jgi:hypothetical protein
VTAIVAALGGILAGYLIGRWRPWTRLGHWADWQMQVDGRWWLATGPRRFVVAAVFATTSPHAAWSAFRHRNDPPPRGPAPAFDPDWAQRRGEQR